jgi:hypothetical protein
MLMITWQEEIASLKQNLNKEINKISRNSDINVRNHICINNLVIIKAAEKTYIEIEPYPVDEMENLIFEFCESIANKDNPQPDQNITIR